MQPLVIDYFLEQNQETVGEIGKLVIAYVLLECEQEAAKKTINPNRKIDPNKGIQDKDRKDNWCRFILNTLVSGAKESKDLLKNNVNFITFNYDVSLEEQLYKGLSNIDIFEEDDIKEFLNKKIHHMYGQLDLHHTNRDNIFPKKITKKVMVLQDMQTGSDRDKKQKTKFEIAHAASQNIRTINNVDKGDSDPAFKEARDLIYQANDFYILGYGFDKNNNNRLGLYELLQKRPLYRRVFFSNFGDRNIENKRASHLFWGHSNDETSFTTKGKMTHGKYRQPPYYEKSTRDVYGALENDFDLDN